MIENLIRRIAGSIIIAAVLLTLFVDENWIYLALFVGLNLLQSSFTGFCPMEKILHKLLHKKQSR
ncbi:MAG: YgaP family membrane protein [Bacteroidales bacterium]